jgi:DNA repair photolyase
MADVVYKPKGAALEYAPWASNIYAGCDNGCLYCYAPRVLHQKKEDFHVCKGVRPGYFERLKKECKSGKHAGKQVLLSFTSDPYQKQERLRCSTRSAIIILHDGGANVTILTKCPTLALRDTDILFPGRDVIATTLTFARGEFAASMHWEPGGDLPCQRIYAMQEFKRQGFETWVSMEPTIVPESTLSLIHQTVGTFDTYKIGKLNYMDTSHIDWARFAGEARRLLEFYELDYIMKESLSRYLT